MAFSIPIERIMRDVNYGWLIRYLHANGASMFFIAVYIHIFRGMYYGSYKAPRELLWILGVVIYLLMMATGVHGLRAALGPDVLLGRHRHHQPVLGLPTRRRAGS
jgi:ubiquinol-cytochrome c reductase cytochrome b/c1 subunit